MSAAWVSILLRSAFVGALVLGLSGCLHEDAAVTEGGSAQRPVAAAVTYRVVVTEDGGGLVTGAEIVAADGTPAGTTGSDGTAEVRVTASAAGSLVVRKPGYAAQVVRPQDQVDGATLQVSLKRRNPPVSVANAERGFTLVGEAGAAVTIPANGLVFEDSGDPVSGEVQVFITPADVTRPRAGGFPGSFRGVPLTGGTADVPIMSYGAVEFHFQTPDGREVNLAPGRQATIRIPVYVNRHPDGATIQAGDSGQAVWYLDETSGIWHQAVDDGVVVTDPNSPTGLALEARVPHFTWWNYDIQAPSCRVSVRVSGLPAGASRVNLVGKVIPAGTAIWPARNVASTTLPAGGAGGIAERTLIFPRGLPFEIAAEAKANGLWYRGSIRFDGGAGGDPCAASTIDIPLQPEVPLIRDFVVRNIRGVWQTDAAGNRVLTGNEVLLSWHVEGAAQVVLTLPDGTQQAYSGTQSHLGMAWVPVDGTGRTGGDALNFSLNASNGTGSATGAVTAYYHDRPGPWFRHFVIEDPIRQEMFIAWDELAGADSIEWGYAVIPGTRILPPNATGIRIGGIANPPSSGMTPDLTAQLPVDANWIYFRADNANGSRIEWIPVCLTPGLEGVCAGDIVIP